MPSGALPGVSLPPPDPLTFNGAARDLLTAPGEGPARVHRAVDKARALGCDVVGLGALTATVTAGEPSLRGRADFGVTNGNAFTGARWVAWVCA